MESPLYNHREITLDSSERRLQSHEADVRQGRRRYQVSMRESILHRESALEYFKELVEGALVNQHVSAGELTAWYVVHLLVAFLRQSSDHDLEPLALKLSKALDAGGSEQRASLKQIGDVTLFVSGFFSDSLRRKPVGVDYYVSVGGYAYNALSRLDTDSRSGVFAELADKFVTFVDVLSEVSERTVGSSNTDLLRLYERWLTTGSPRSGKLLIERGIVPNASLKGSSIQ
jgi:hypothetical protein